MKLFISIVFFLSSHFAFAKGFDSIDEIVGVWSYNHAGVEGVLKIYDLHSEEKKSEYIKSCDTKGVTIIKKFDFIYYGRYKIKERSNNGEAYRHGIWLFPSHTADFSTGYSSRHRHLILTDYNSFDDLMNMLDLDRSSKCSKYKEMTRSVITVSKNKDGMLFYWKGIRDDLSKTGSWRTIKKVRARKLFFDDEL